MSAKNKIAERLRGESRRNEGCTTAVGDLYTQGVYDGRWRAFAEAAEIVEQTPDPRDVEIARLRAVLAEVEGRVGTFVAGRQQEQARLRALVESAYREGWRDVDYDRPVDIDACWLASDARAALEVPRE